MNARKRLLIVFHSQTGNTARLAEAVLRGAQRVEEAALGGLDLLPAHTGTE